MLKSKHAYFHKRNNSFIAFNNLIFEPVLLTQEEFDRIQTNDWSCFDNNDIEILKSKGILVSDEVKDDTAEKVFLEEMGKAFKNDVELLYIIPTNRCNLACKYCFIGELNSPVQNMSTDTLNNIIEKYREYANGKNIKKVLIIFYGAEPLLSFNFLKIAIERFSKLPMKVEFSLVTNGTLLTQEMINFFEGYDLSLGLSVDGPKEYNDLNRVYKGASMSVYDASMKALEMLKSSKVPYALSVTITKDVLNHKEQYLNWLLDLKVPKIGFNLLHYQQYEDDFEQYYTDASNFIYDINSVLESNGVIEDRMERKKRAFFLQQFAFSDCGAVGATQLCFAPNGDATICHAYWNTEEDKCGNINELSIEEILLSQNVDKWKKELTLYKQECINCPGFYICGRGCVKQAKDVFKCEGELDKGFCIHTLTALNKLLDDFQI